MENPKWGVYDMLLRAKLCKVVCVCVCVCVCIYDKKHFYLNFQSCLRYGIILCGGDSEGNKIFKLQKKAL
jgi:hypothetical protein